MIIRVDFMKKYIDLTKIVSISDAYFIDRMGSGGYYVGFDIECQLLEKPIHYERKLAFDEEDRREGTYTAYPKRVDFSKERALGDIRHEKTLAEIRLQRQINELVTKWMEVTNADNDW